MDSGARLKTYRELVDSRLQDLLPPESDPPLDLHKAMRYSCLAPGKRLRPALCLAAAEAVGYPTLSDDIALKGHAPLEAACALEMVHCFSLIHDDLPAIDNDELRRGKNTTWKEFGEGMALLAGDALFSLAFETLSHVASEPQRVMIAVRALAVSTGSNGLVGGEVMDVLSEGRDFDAETVDFIHSRKTGALISASCEIGGVLGGGTQSQVKKLADFGSHIGMAFQIVDDVLNETSTSEQLGKAARSDRNRKKATYPALFGVDLAKEKAEEHMQKAIGILDGSIRNQEVLKELAMYVVERFH